MRRFPACLLLLAAGCRGEDVLLHHVEDRGALETSSAIKGRDGGYSAAWRGRSIWLYGDTILSRAGADGSSWRHNSWSFTEDLDGSDGISGFEERSDPEGAPAELFPQTAEEEAFNRAHSGEECEDPCGARRILWPGPIVVDAERDRALVFYEKIYGEPGEWNFRGLGKGIAIWEDFASQPARPALGVIAGEPTLLFGAGEPGFGNAALAAGGYVYAYACDGGFTKECKVGRAPLEDPLDRSSWQAFDGRGWSGQLADAKPVLDGGAMMSVHWNEHLGAYLAVYSRPLADQICARLAPAPEGPWSDEVVLFEAESSHDGDPSYAGLAHAEYAREGGRYELITYFRGTGDWTGEIRMVEVRLDSP